MLVAPGVRVQSRRRSPYRARHRHHARTVEPDPREAVHEGVEILVSHHRPVEPTRDQLERSRAPAGIQVGQQAGLAGSHRFAVRLREGLEA
ncbi:MAG: hypothetical protein ACR2K4_03730 [Candidatus Limnocylindria bacterium]